MFAQRTSRGGGRAATLAAWSSISLLFTAAALPLTAPAWAESLPDEASRDSAHRGAEFLAARQGADGSTPSGSTANATAEALVALVAGRAPEQSINGALDFLAVHGPAGASNGPYTGRIVKGLVAAGENPRDFAGYDYVARLESFYNAGSYGDDTVYGELLAMIGVLAAGEEVPFAALTRLKASQCADGGWAWTPGCAGKPDTDTTSLAVAVLAASDGADASEVQRGRQWLVDARGSAGCWPHNIGGAEASNSCGLAISAVLALGEDPREAPWADADGSPVSSLRGFQTDSGGFRFLRTSNSADNYATIQAVPAVAGWAHPARPPAEPSDEPDEPDEPDDPDEPDEPDEGEGGTGGSTSTTSATPNPGSSPSGGGKKGQAAGSRSGATSPSRPPLGTTPPEPSTGTTPPTAESTPTTRLPWSAFGPADALGFGGSRRSREVAGGGARLGPPVRVTIEGDGGGGVGGWATGLGLGAFAPAASGTGWVWRRRLLDPALSVVSPREIVHGLLSRIGA